MARFVRLSAVIVSLVLIAGCGRQSPDPATTHAAPSAIPTPAVIELGPFHSDQACAGRPSRSPAADPPVKFLVDRAGQPITTIEHRVSGQYCRPPEVAGANVSGSGEIEGWFSLEPDAVPGDYPSEQVNAGAKRLRLRGTHGWIMGHPAASDAPEVWILAWVENGSLQRWESQGLTRHAVLAMIDGARIDPDNPALLVPPRSSVDRMTITGARSTSGQSWRVVYGTAADEWKMVIADSAPIDGPPFGSMPEQKARLLHIGGHEILYGQDAAEGLDENSDPITTPPDVATWTDDQGRRFDLFGAVSVERLRSIVQHLVPVA